jgi:quercetin dioxygenase-like cupin family protein
MKSYSALLLTLLLIGAIPSVADAEPLTKADAVQILRSGSRPSRAGELANFTGSVRLDPLFAAAAPSRMSGASVTFEPGARSNWHTHPVGQVLIVTAGLGWVRQWGAEIQEMRPGDVIQIPPGVRHWHGASPTTSVTHIALQEQLEGRAVDWMEPVSDAQYRR